MPRLASLGCALALVFAGPSAALKFAGAPDEVTLLHSKLEKIATALDGMLSSKGSLSHAAVAPAMKSFLHDLRVTLNETAAPTNRTAAFHRLKAAQAGVTDLTAALTKQQEKLMHEGDAEEASLLMGVLMTRRNEPIEKQFAILKDPQFSNLAVSKELLAKHDASSPLFQQVAAYMDKHGGKVAPMGKAEQLSKTLTYFESRVTTLEDVERRMQKAHAMALSRFDELAKESKSKNAAHRYEMLKKHSDRQYKKTLAVQQQQLKMMKSVVAALKSGDVNALKKAQDALKASMKAMQAKTGNFLHLLQLGHRLQSRDCPYCAAQCIDKCHSAGNPYTTCLAECADAGK